MNNELTLFDQPKPEVNQSMVNSIESFHSENVKIKRSTQKEKVLLAIKHMKEPSQRDISDMTGIERHLIPDRVLSLKEMGLVEIAGTKICPTTKKTVNTYRIKVR